MNSNETIEFIEKVVEFYERALEIFDFLTKSMSSYLILGESIQIKTSSILMSISKLNETFYNSTIEEGFGLFQLPSYCQLLTNSDFCFQTEITIRVI